VYPNPARFYRPSLEQLFDQMFDQMLVEPGDPILAK
jgi:hypothetical protein